MILKRLHEFLVFKNISFNKFEIVLGVSHGSISNAVKHKKNIGTNVLEKILEKYPRLSSEWLLRGKGEMLISTKKSEDKFEYNGWDDLLLEQTLDFFGFENKKELQMFYIKNYKQENQSTLENLIISTWEQQYGQELKSLGHQVSTLFTAKLEDEKQSDAISSNSKTA